MRFGLEILREKLGSLAKAPKVGLFNNMNNNYFSLARYLRDLGCEVTLFTMSEQPQFHPLNDTYNLNDLSLVQDINWYEIGHWEIDVRQIRDIIDKLDFTIGTDYVPAYFYKASRRLDILFPHGGEIFSKPYFSFNFKKPFKPQIGSWYLAYCLRKGLRQTNKISAPYQDVDFEKHYEILGIQKKRVFYSCPILYLPQYSAKNLDSESNFFIDFINNKKKSGHFIVGQQLRQEITNLSSLHYKGNDKLIRACSELVSEKRLSLHLILFEYGADVDASKSLIRLLNFSNYVTWIPLMPRKLIMKIIPHFDVGVGMIANRTYPTYGTVIEYMASKIPFIHRFDYMLNPTDTFKTLYHTKNVKTEVDIKKGLVEIFDNYEKEKCLAVENEKWLWENTVIIPLEFIVNEIINKLDA